MRNASSIGWICFVIAGLAAITPILCADDKTTPADSDGYKTVPVVGSDGKTTNIRVQKQPQPDARLSSTSSDGKYDPTQYNLNKTSSFANKSFPDAFLYQNNGAQETREQHSFITKSYFTDNGSPSNQPALADFNTKATYPVTDAYTRTAPGLDKSYTANQTDAAQNKSAQFTAGASEYQNRAVTLETHKIDTSASPLANKTYTGPEAVLEQREMSKLNQGLMQMKDLPNRPLTIDEVRDLINHGVKPDTDAAPAPSSKPLNDPDYKPEPALPLPPPDTSDEDVPSPGILAAQHQQQEAPPENSEPLPK
ncbi:MAG: hypothetical protein LV481_04575 [Methylacidiphilales bacterium]|nr:hypothetical protein [Candidatus Methylacidiphilales bacterium]